ncbi:putative spermidine/putrescine transport system permease protein [Palleronia aestuarii]|uniref:Putative spermidine/putrescine transport system permease protein n=1 Tax=Palleronia aestuarii TaxID=568105 RepID=A0A2W7QDC6_9RHOB|nr:ABC transporter permease [Palleronia aestuarii]PZX19869.1 putative spermidine/putrescine transport system permease protein [Palleronia aestuarii]
MTKAIASQSGRRGRALMDRRRLGRAAMLATGGFAFLYILVPLIFVTWLSFYRQEIPSYPPEGYSLRWYGAAAANERFIDAFLVSIQLGVISTAIGLAVALPAALGITRLRFRGRGALANMLLLPLIVPGIVLGFALYVFQVEIEIATSLPLLGSLGGLVWGHVLLVIPWATRLITASLEGFDRTLEEAAQNLGANRLTTFRRVTMPMILPGIVAGAIFGFVSSFGNLEVSLFLVGPGRTTLPIAILQYLQWKIDPTIAAISVLQITIIAAAMLVTDRFVKISRVV